MSHTIAFSHDFIVAEQLSGRYCLHIFESKEQFRNWRRDHADLRIVDRTSARGRQFQGFDHRNEFEYL